MPSSESKPLFRPEALRPRLAKFQAPADAAALQTKVAGWAQLLASKEAEGMKETELLGEFLTDLFCHLLGYRGPAAGQARYTLKRGQSGGGGEGGPVQAQAGRSLLHPSLHHPLHHRGHDRPGDPGPLRRPPPAPQGRTPPTA